MPTPFLEACHRRDKTHADALIGLDVPGDWFDETDLIGARLTEFNAHPTYAKWGLRAVAISNSTTMIGHVGFHSLPNPEYLHPYWPDAIELAYTVYPQHRRNGHGFEAVSGLMHWALGCASIRRFLVSVAAENAASRALAAKLGFVKVEEYFDHESNQRHLVYVLQGAGLSRLAEGK